MYFQLIFLMWWVQYKKLWLLSFFKEIVQICIDLFVDLAIDLPIEFENDVTIEYRSIILISVDDVKGISLIHKRVCKLLSFSCIGGDFNLIFIFIIFFLVLAHQDVLNHLFLTNFTFNSFLTSWFYFCQW